MRVSEALQLRVKDVDFSHQALIVREGKGGEDKDRVLTLLQTLVQPLRDQLAQARQLASVRVKAFVICHNARQLHRLCGCSLRT